MTENATDGTVRLTAVPDASRNPYITLLYRHLVERGVELVPDRWIRPAWAAGTGGAPEFLHLHWPERFYEPPGPLRRAIESPRFFRRLTRLREAGTRVAWTLHNAVAHEIGDTAHERACRARLMDMTDLLLVNFEGARAHVEQEYGRTDGVHVVPHGSYRGWYRDDVTRDEARRALGIDTEGPVYLVFGDLRPYKNLEGVIAAFRRLPDPDARLRIVGKPDFPAVVRSAREAAEGDARVVVEPRRVPDDEVQWYFRGTDALVLGRSAFSSGTAVLAVDFDLPIVAPRVDHVADVVPDAALVDFDPAGGTESLVAALARVGEVDRESAAAACAAASARLAWPAIAGGMADLLRRFRAPA